MMVLVAVPGFATDEGRREAVSHCSGCHLFVEPDQLSKPIWRDVIVPRMGRRLGMHLAGYPYPEQRESGAPRAVVETVYPDKPLVATEEWDALVSYLVANAPDEPIPAPKRPPIDRELEQFHVRPISFPGTPPATTMVEIVDGHDEVLVGHMANRSVAVVTAAGRLAEEVYTGNIPVAARREADALWVTGIGSFLPSDEPQGDLVRFDRSDGAFRFDAAGWMLGELQRPVHTSYADVTGDGLEDIVMSEFGDLVGRLSLYERLAGSPPRFRRHVLLAEPGSQTTVVRDLDDDGDLDVAAVLGQGREGIHLFFNESGAGQIDFRHDYALPVPPTYGSTHFELHDFNADGHLDVLATHGDNGDYESILKRYHGIRIYLNDGSHRFREAFFFQQHGAFKAMARDFDGDGDLDIAAISAFPDYAAPDEGFVYLEQSATMRFEAATFDDVGRGRWLTMDAGDIDGDGDLDVALGSFSTLRVGVPAAVARRWEEAAINLVVLENRLR